MTQTLSPREQTKLFIRKVAESKDDLTRFVMSRFYDELGYDGCDDLTNDVFVNLDRIVLKIATARKLDLEKPLRLAFRVAHNLGRNLVRAKWRSQSRYRPLSEVAIDPAAPTPVADGLLVDWEAFKREVKWACENLLTDWQRTVFCTFDTLTAAPSDNGQGFYERLAVEAGRTPASVRSALRLGLMKIREHLNAIGCFAAEVDD